MERRKATRAALGAEGRRLGSYVYDVVKERLLDGEWHAGQYLAVEALKTELQVSKQPVMDALRRLASDGLVEIIPQVGSRVPVYGDEEVADFFSIFASMESEATAVAARRCTDAQIGALEAINAEIGELLSLDDPRERVHMYRLLNRQFHTVILEMANSSLVIRTSERMWDTSDLIINTVGISLPVANDVGERHADHNAIIEALRNSDLRTARKAMRGHILRNIGMLQKIRRVELHREL